MYTAKLLVRQHTLFAFLALSIAGLLISGCGTTSEDPNVVEARTALESGLIQLQLGEYGESRIYLEPLVSQDGVLSTALAKDPEAKNQARLAFVIANTLYSINDTIDSIVATIALFQGQSSDQQKTQFTSMAGQGLLSGVLDAYLDDAHDFFAEMEGILADVDEDFTLDLTYLPVKIGDIKIVEAGGEYDLGEAQLLMAFFRLAMGTMQGFLSLDYTINLTNFPLQYVFDTVGALGDSDDVLGDLSNLLAVILYTQPNLLALGSAETMKQAGVDYAKTFQYFAQALETMSAETDAQDDDILGYYTTSDPDEDEIVIHADFIPLPIPGISTTAFSDLEIRFKKNFLTNLDTIEKSFSGTGSKRISWANDVVPIVAISAKSLVGSGAFNGLIYEGLKSAGLEDAAIESLLQFINGADLSLFEGLIVQGVPDMFEFDMGAYFLNPQTGLRDYFPFWTVPTTTTLYTEQGNVSEIITHWESATLFLEWECQHSEELDVWQPPLSLETGKTTFLCDANAAVDTEHFVRESLYSDDFFEEHGDYAASLELDPSVYGLTYDGIRSRFPYFALRDPSLGQTLWIKLDENAISQENQVLEPSDEYRLADNYTLNALLHGWLSGLLATLGLE